MKKILNALFLTIITLVTFSCSDVPAPYDINEGGGSSALEGEGTKDNPYTVADAISKQDGSEAWVKGYIVGIMGNKYKPDGTTFDGNIPVFVAPFNIDTNVLIAATAGETNIKKCLPVKVKGGSDLAKAINLKDHPDNLGKPLIIKGKLAAGFGTAALIETTAAVFDGKDIGDAGGGKPEGAYIYETFSTSLGGFKSVSVSGTLEWHNDFSSAMVKGGSATEKFPSQTWLVAPTIDLTTETAAYISFDHAINYADAATIKEYHQLMISKDYTTDVAAATWTSLNITMASGNSFTFINSGKVSIPAEFLGQSKVTVALKYTSTETTGSTWEVQKFTVAHGEGGSIIDPIEPEIPSTGLGSKDEPYDVTTVLTKQDNTKAWVKGFIVGGVISDAAGNTVDVASDVVFGTEGVRNGAILIAATKDEKDFKKCLVIGFGSDSNTAKTALNLVDNKDKLGKEVKLCGTFKNAFSAPGMKTIIDFVLVDGGGVDPTPSTDLLISEYVEGASFEKYIEIYNPSTQAVDLATYTLKLEPDGKGAWTKEFKLTGSIASHGVVVYKNSQAKIYTGVAIVNDDVINFNGNDPVGLFKNDVLIDLFGISSATPGTAVADFAKDKTFKRKSTVKAPSSTYKTEEWDELGKDDVSGLGSHTMN